MKFIDSYALLRESVEQLVHNLYAPKEKYIKVHKCRIFGDSMGPLCRTGFYLYEWVDVIEMLNHERLPQTYGLYSQLRNENTFMHLNITSMQDII